MLKVRCVRNKIASENTYFVFNERAILIIDPGSDKDALLKMVKKIGKEPLAILLTHTHYDHIMGISALCHAYPKLSVYVSKNEASWLYTPQMNLSGLFRHQDMEDVVIDKADEFFTEDKEYNLGGITFQAISTSGHSIGGMSFVFNKFLFTGDALFKGTIGRVDLPTGDLDQLVTNIKQKLFILPDEFNIFPGHGKDTTIGAEKSNPFLT
ncbi:MAG: MBL fold metallo-hydrolase [Lactobacillales bacterium]|jgi:glyoxylase-like metal-dependent hydrolase (beta-lactamase superfamily II)|nr:MBL fold metallo-hydrolase [Lactobacillales bacterium]